MFMKFEVRPIAIAETGEVTPFNLHAEAVAHASEEEEQVAFGLYGQEADGHWMNITDNLSKERMLEVIYLLFGLKPDWPNQDRIEFNRSAMPGGRCS